MIADVVKRDRLGPGILEEQAVDGELQGRGKKCVVILVHAACVNSIWARFVRHCRIAAGLPRLLGQLQGRKVHSPQN